MAEGTQPGLQWRLCRLRSCRTRHPVPAYPKFTAQPRPAPKPTGGCMPLRPPLTLACPSPLTAGLYTLAPQQGQLLQAPGTEQRSPPYTAISPRPRLPAAAASPGGSSAIVPLPLRLLVSAASPGGRSSAIVPLPRSRHQRRPGAPCPPPCLASMQLTARLTGLLMKSPCTEELIIN